MDLPEFETVHLDAFKEALRRNAATSRLEHPKNLPILIEQKLVSFKKATKSICADRHAIARLARRMASTAELGHALNKSGSRVASIVSTMGVRPIGCGWDRVDCVRLGILSPLPDDGEVG